MNSLKAQAEEIVLSEIVYSIWCGQAGLMESACSSQSSFCGFLTRQNNDSRFVKNTIHEPSKQRWINTNINKIDYSKFNLILSFQENDWMRRDKKIIW